MLDKKQIERALNAIIYEHGTRSVHVRNDDFYDLLESLAAFSRSIEHGHFDVKGRNNAG